MTSVCLLQNYWLIFIIVSSVEMFEWVIMKKIVTTMEISKTNHKEAHVFYHQDDLPHLNHAHAWSITIHTPDSLYWYHKILSVQKPFSWKKVYSFGNKTLSQIVDNSYLCFKEFVVNDTNTYSCNFTINDQDRGIWNNSVNSIAYNKHT